MAERDILLCLHAIHFRSNGKQHFPIQAFSFLYLFPILEVAVREIYSHRVWPPWKRFAASLSCAFWQPF